MDNRGVLLYVDLGRLEDEPYRLSKIYDTLGQYIDDIRRQRDIIYISKMAESLSDSTCYSSSSQHLHISSLFIVIVQHRLAVRQAQSHPI